MIILANWLVVLRGQGYSTSSDSVKNVDNIFDTVLILTSLIRTGKIIKPDSKNSWQPVLR